MLLIAAALLPPLILIAYIYRKDRVEKEPLGLLLKLFLAGAFSTLPALLLENGADLLLPYLTDSDLIYLLLENFLGVALVEEGCKYWFLKKRTWKDPHFNYQFDALVYGVTLSLGFAAAENILYVIDGGLSVALLRGLTSIPGHGIFGVYMGYYYGMGKAYDNLGEKRAGKHKRRLAVAVPVLLHGAYDLILSPEEGEVILIFLAYVLLLDVLTLRQINRSAREDGPV